MDGIHLTRTSDIIGGLGITTATKSLGRGVEIAVDAGSAGLVTTATIRTIAGHPLRVTSSTLNYVDIGTTGGTFWTPSNSVRFDRENRLSPTYLDLEEIPGVQIVENITRRPIFPGSGTFTNITRGDPFQILDGTTSDVLVRMTGTQFEYLTAVGTTAFTQSNLTFPVGHTNAYIELAGANSSMYVGGASSTWPSPQSGSVHAGQSVLAKNDVHAGDAMYVGDPLGNITGTPITNSHMRSYGNLQVNPDSTYRSNQVGWFLLSTTGGSTDTQICIYTEPTLTGTDGGAFISLYKEGRTFNGRQQLSILAPTYVTGQFGATNDIYTSASVFAGNDVNATDDVAATDDVTAGDDVIATDLVQGADVTATDDVSVGDDLTVTSEAIIPTVNGSTSANGDITIQGTSSATRTTSYVGIQPSGGNVDIGANNVNSEFSKLNVTAVDPQLNYGALMNLTDTASLAAGIGARILLGSTYTNGGDLTGGVVLQASKTNATTANYAYDFKLGTRPNGGNITTRLTVSDGGRVSVGSAVASSGAMLQTPSLAIPSTGATIDGHWTGTNTVDVASIAAAAIGTLTVTVTGASTGDVVQLGPPAAIEAGLTWSGFVSASNTVTIRLHNTTGSAVDPASATWRASVTSY